MAVYRRETRRRPVLLLALVTALALVTLDSRGSGIIDTFRSAARDVIAPVQELVDDAFSPVSDAFHGVTGYGSLKEENVELRRRLAEAEGKLARERAVGSEVGEIEKLLDLPTIEDADGIAVRVVGGSPGNFERTVQVNKGSSSGIEAGMPVVAGDGAVGTVVEVSSSRATVRLLDSPGFGLGVRLEKNPSVRGVTEGRTGERELRMGFLENGDGEIALEQLAYTALYAGSSFPPDIAVGRVVEVTRAKDNLERTIVLRPLVDLDDLTYLKVLRVRPQPLTDANPGS
jgi:rod shape-determining protein MreC